MAATPTPMPREICHAYMHERHGYIYIYIYVYMYRERERDRYIPCTYVCKERDRYVCKYSTHRIMLDYAMLSCIVGMGVGVGA